MAKETPEMAVGQFQSATDLLASSLSLQIAFAVLIIGIVVIVTVYKKFSNWIESQKFRYSRPHYAKFAKTALLPFFAIALVSSVNAYVQVTELFGQEATPVSSQNELSPQETFAKILNTIDIIVIGYTVGRLIPIFLDKREMSGLLKQDFEEWKEMRGFSDDKGDLFHKLYEWIPPKNTPPGMKKEEFEENLKTEEGRKKLVQYRTSKGTSIGSFRKLVQSPFNEWLQSERQKYEEYYEACISGNNESGQKLRPGATPQEIFPFDVWLEQKRLNNYEPVVAGDKSPGYGEKKRQGLPRSLNQVIPSIILAAVAVGVISWWGVDLFVLGTAIAGLGVGVGFALKETLENLFAYLMIRKDKIFIEGDRVEIDNYNGYIHKITTRVTYVRHALNESMAIFPTRQLVAAKVINFSKELKFVPAMVGVGVSYLNNSKQVAAILTKVGQRAMREVKDDNGSHIVTQNRCPYLDQNLPSCGCDKDVVVDIIQPRVRFDEFGGSSLDFRLWVYVKDYGSQFKVESAMRMMIQEEFERYDIRIPWPIRTIYQGDEKREAEEIGKIDKERQDVLNEYGTGDVKFDFSKYDS